MPKVLLACVGVFAVVAFFRTSSTVEPMRSEVREDSHYTSLPKATAKASNHFPWKSILATLVTLPTLVFAYLAVAENAHWFPWQIDTPSISADLVSGAQSASSWLNKIINLTTFLQKNNLQIVHLKLDMQSYNNQLFSSLIFGTAAQYIYVKEKPPPGGVKDISMGSGCPYTNAPCTVLALFITSGPGSDLGYDDGDSAAEAFIDGYYKVGGVSCQTGTCEVNLIPVTPPG
jgi:hypothetical protein